MKVIPVTLLKRIIFLPLLVLLLMVSSCNSKPEESDDGIAVGTLEEVGIEYTYFNSA